MTLSFSPVPAQDLVGEVGKPTHLLLQDLPMVPICPAKLGFVLTKGKEHYIYRFQGKSSNTWSCRSQLPKVRCAEALDVVVSPR